MEKCKIIDYSEEWRDALRGYMHKRFPSYSDIYIDYCLDHSSGKMPSTMVLNGKDEVVGCHLYYCTKVLIQGEEIDTYWGHDTFLDEEYRADFGLDFILHNHSTKCFGLGLSDVNKKIQKKFKTVFFEGVYNCYMVNWKLGFSVLQRLFHVEPKLYIKEKLIIGKHVFRLVHNVEDMDIPNRGYWFGGERDIDFIRDASFLKERFFSNKVHHYYLYSLEDKDNPCYFVVRLASYRGFPVLTLSDYRYSDSSTVSVILKLVRKIARKSNLGILLFVCGDKHLENAVKGTIHYMTLEDFTAERKISPDLSFCITGADSDADLLK